MEPRTLVLNAWMAPHSIASWQQAICLLVTGKVDVLEEYEAVVSSPSVTIRVPAVARLRIVTSCYACNSCKNQRTPKEVGMRMHFQPHRPRVLPMTQPLLVSVDAMPDAWKPYLESAWAARATGLPQRNDPRGVRAALEARFAVLAQAR